ncbi:MAG: chemotaxis protein CheA [Proteobacteria bacterium]|nr:chemotaxis protein CheA [Pseudomonadota bacterium]
MVDVDFLPTFLDEASETLERWESVCLKLENSASPELLDDLFRSAHNIKGSSKSVGLVEFGALVHRAEDVITRMKNGEIKPNPSAISALLECQKSLCDWVEKLRDEPTFVLPTQQILEKLSEFLQVKDPEKMQEDLGFGLFDEDLASKEPIHKDLGTILIEAGSASVQQIEDAVKLQSRRLGEVLVDTGVVTPDTIKAALEIQKGTGHKQDESIRVSLRKLDSVIRLIGELSIQHAIVCNARDVGTVNEFASVEAIGLAHKVIQDLQSEAMSLRMQTLEVLFQRMERVCRDVAMQQQKSIQVVLKGTEVELDKTVIERMKDPLVHILRNAVDHGIEDAEGRAQSEKPAIATLTIEGIQTAGNVSIRISDDGRGLNEERILRKAIERGLVSASAKPSKEEIHQMIFLPGFSTAEKVTDVSGRGVGMDVVRRAVDDLGGSIAIESRLGHGTQFLINLPSTLSIVNAVVINLSDKLYAVPVQDVEEVVDMSSVQIERTTQRGRVINLRGRILPVERLATFLPPHTQDSIQSERKSVAIIARHQSTTVALEVDGIVGQQSIVVRQLEGKLSQVPGFSGGTILASGEPSMIIHLPQIVKSYASLAK